MVSEEISLTDEIVETSTEYVRRTLAKFDYSKPRTSDREWHTVPAMLPQMGVSRSGPEITASDAILDN